MATKKRTSKVVPIGSGKSAAHEASMAAGEPVFQQELAVQLTEAELLERGDQHATAQITHERLLVERKEVTGKLNVKIREAVAQCTELAHAVDSGTEKRLVDVQWQEDRVHQCKRLVRLDTKEVVEERAMTTDELQEDLDL
jgi:hypothetical protein